MSTPRINAVAGWALLLVGGGGLALAGYWLLFSTFMVYDDEGFVLISLRNFLTAGPLYDAVFTQYGPFFYLVHKALPLLGGWEWTNTAARWVTLVYWLATAGFAAATVKHLTRSFVATFATFTGAVGYLWVMTHEPGHPGGMIGLLVALAAWLGAQRNPAAHPATAAAIAALGAAMALTKINTGAFLLLALWTWLAGYTPPGPARRLTRGVAVLAAAVGPGLIMTALLGQSWVQQYALTVSLAALSGLALAWRVASPTVAAAAAGPAWRAAALSGVGVTAMTLTAILLAGSSVSGVLNGVLLDALRHPGVYSFAFVWRPGSLAVALGAAGLIGTACLGKKAPAWVEPAIGGARVLAALAFALAALTWLPISMPAFGLSYGVALAAISAYPLVRDESARARQWIALVFVWQSLHAYPVAGSQLNWGTFLWVPLLVLATEETLRWHRRQQPRPWAGPLAASATLAVAVVLTATLTSRAYHNHRSGDPLGLPGAESIVVPSSTAYPIRILAHNAARYADPLFSFTGAYSFNLWTGLPTPTLANATHWFTLLKPAQQAAIIEALHAAPRAAVVVQLDTVRFLMEENFPLDGPLARYLAQNFHSVLEVDGYALWVKRDRTITPLDVGQWIEPGQVLTFTTDTDLSAATSAMFWRFDGDLRTAVAGATDEAFVLTTTALAGQPGLQAVRLELTASLGPLIADTLLRFTDAAGHELVAVRMQP